MKKRCIALLLTAAMLTSISVQAVPIAEERGADSAEESLQLISAVEEHEADAQTATELSSETLSGYCGGEGDGTNLTWTLTPDGTLTIRGSGAMADYSYQNFAPWHDYYDSMHTLVLEEGITYIGNEAFHFCWGFEGVLEIPDTVKEIGSDAFADCDFKRVVFPDGLSKIGEYAFLSCDIQEATLTLPAALSELGELAFDGCEVSEFSISSSNQYFSTVDGVLCDKAGTTLLVYPAAREGAFSIPYGVTTIASSAFSRHTSYSDPYDVEGWELTIPDTVTTIEEYAITDTNFSGKLVIPDSVTYIGWGAFSRNEYLTEVELSDSLTEIADDVFRECTNLNENVVIPAGIEEIGSGAFYGCENLDGICFEGDAPWGIWGTGEVMDASFPEDITLYYIEGTDGWTNRSHYDADAETWCGYSLKTWDGSNQESGDGGRFQILPANDCGLEVGESLTLDVKNLPKGATKADVVWTYDERYVSMSGTTITGIAPGIAGISAEIVIDGRHEAYDYREIAVYTLSGTCGAEGNGGNLTWQIAPDTNSLTISGTGPMADYVSLWSEMGDEYNSAPWYPYCVATATEYGGKPLKLVVKDGVTSIGDYAFSSEFGTLFVSDVDLPDSIVRIGQSPGLWNYSGSHLPADLVQLDDSALYMANFADGVIYIPEGVTALGDYSLYTYDWTDAGTSVAAIEAAYFYGNAPETFGENVFFPSDNFTIYYIEGKDGWMDSDAYDAEAGAWNGYTLATWEGAAEENPEEKGSVTFTFPAGFGGGNCYKYEFPYSDTYFTGDSRNYQHEYESDFAALSMGVAYAAYSYRCKEDGHKTRGMDYGIKNALVDQLGFESFESDSYVYQENGYRGDRNSIASAFAIKELSNGETVIAVAVRGGNYDGEWDANFEVGDTILCGGYEFHKNFFESAMEILHRLNDYIGRMSSQYDLENAKLWICGYSRGAAVANVTAHFAKMTQFNSDTTCYDFPYLGYDEADIYAYTFATPAPVKTIACIEGDSGDPYIVNIVGYSDFVPMVVMSDWGYSRFGHTITLPGKIGSASSYASYYKTMQENYADIMQKSDRENTAYATYAAVNNRRTAIRGALTFVSELVGNTDTYTEEFQEVIIDIVGSCGLYRKDPDAFERSLGELKDIALSDKDMLKIVFEKVYSSANRNLSEVEEKATVDIVKKLSSNILEIDLSESFSAKNLIRAVFYNFAKENFGMLSTSGIGFGGFDPNDLEGSLYQLILDFVKRNCADGYFVWEWNSTAQTYMKVYCPLECETYARHVVDALKDTIGIDSLGGINADIVQEHFPELYLAWIMSLRELDLNEWFKSNAIKSMWIMCPTDVKVYDKSGNLLVSVIDNEVIGDGLYARVNLAGEKEIHIPLDMEVDVDIVATDAGTMNVVVAVYDGDGICTRQVFYNDVALTTEKRFELWAEEGEEGAVVLSHEGETITEDGTVIGEAIYADVSAVVDGNGVVIGTGTYQKGMKATLLAVEELGYQFDGWYVDDVLISNDARYEFSVTDDTKLAAKFTDASEYYSQTEKAVIVKDISSGIRVFAASYKDDQMMECSAAIGTGEQPLILPLSSENGAQYIKVFKTDNLFHAIADPVGLNFS